MKISAAALLLVVTTLSCAPEGFFGIERALREIDTAPAWAPDGSEIAYHRYLPSSDGPPGVYLISPTGGTPRFLMPAGYDGPWSLRFSPDSKSLVGEWYDGLGIIDVASGTKQSISTVLTAREPDWSPDGRSIVYRGTANLADWSIWIVTPATMQDTVLTSDGQPVHGHFPRWSPDGADIVFSDYTGIWLIHPDGSSLRRITTAPNGGIHDYPRWLDDDRILFTEFGKNQRTAEVNRAGTESHLLPTLLGSLDDIDPTHSRAVIRLAYDSGSGIEEVLLFTVALLDLRGFSRRQLTFYQPPDSSAPPTATIPPQ